MLTIGINHGDTTYTGTISGTGTGQLAKAGSGAFTIEGSLNVAEPIQLARGTFIFDGDINTNMASGIQGYGGVHVFTVAGTGRVRNALDLTGGVLSPGSPGSTGVSVYGSLRAGVIYGSNHQYACDISDSGQDRLISDALFGDATTCTLNLNLIEGGLTQPAYVIVDYGTLEGEFESILGLPAGYRVDYAYDDGVDSANIAIVADSTAPALETIGRASSTSDPTNANTVEFDLQFSENVLLSTTDFEITTSDNSILYGTPQLIGTHDSYRFSLPDVEGDGTLTVGIRADHSITDPALNPLLPTALTASVQVDNTPPVITLLGNATPTLVLGSSWSDPGVSVSDNLDADVLVDIGGDSVDPSLPGSYTITYDATDAAGNPAIQVTRTVTVRTVIDDWLATHGLSGDDALLSADPDGDGRSNLEEFAFDGDPVSAAAEGKQRVAQVQYHGMHFSR